MLSLLTPAGLVRQWSLVNGEARCLLDPLDPLDPNAASAYGRSIYIKGLLERDAAYPPAPPVPAEGEEPDPDWTPPEMDADVALLRRVRSGPQPVENEDGSITEDETYDADVQALVDLVNAADPVLPPISPPEVISDQQFAFGLAIIGRITQAEALAFATVGTLPADLQEFIDAIEDPNVRWAASMHIAGTKEFRRNHPLVMQVAAFFNMSAREIDALWLTCSRL